MKQVAIEELSRFWPLVESWLGRAVAENPTYEGPLDVLIALARGVYTLWYAETFAAVTQVVRHPKCAALSIVYCGGKDLEAMQKAFEFAKRYCRANGIDVIRIDGRRGWQRVLGLEPVSVTLQARVNE